MTVPVARAHLLIVDDDPAQLQALCSVLELEGFATTGFSSATAALESLVSQRYDLLLTDLSMPGMDGIDFLNSARKHDPQIIGIVMTGHGSIDTAVAAMKAGALDYILKPFTLRMILPVLERALTVHDLRNENIQLREAQDTIRRLNTDLERCVEERTRQLSDANQELEAFSHSVSHDLRAPLRSVNAFTSLLAEQYDNVLDDRARGYIRRVQSATWRMSQLIDDLLRLSHTSATELQRIEVDMAPLTEGILADLRNAEPDRNVVANVAAPLLCNADPRLLRVALENLLGNAWKFTRNVREARVEVGRAAAAPQPYYVRDNGAGFDPAQADSMFTPFFRLHTEAEFPGTGIGLSIVQRIIHRHGGRIWAEGAPGSGATFFFTLPRSRDPLTQECS